MQKILAIDDKIDNLVALSALLKNLMPDCVVITAQSGMEGIQKAKAELPDVILLDVKMPEMDGFETCRRLKADESTKIIPVIMITAIKTDPQSRIKGLEIGADAFLAKPIDEQELVSQVKVALRIKKAEDALREERNSLEKKVQERTEALQESEGRFRYVLENVREAFWSADLSGNYDFLSPMMEQIYGRSLLEMIDNKAFWIETVHPEDKATVQASGDTLVRDGQAELEYRIVLPDGTKRWVFDRKTVILDAYGKPSSIAGILYDITERKQAEEVLRVSESKLRAVLDSTPFPVALVDVQDNIVDFWSQSALNLFGHTAPTASEWYEIAYPDPNYRREVIDRWKPFLQIARESSQTVNTGEYMVTCSDGSVRICELYAAFLADRLIVTFNDITDRKRAAEEKAKLEAQLFQSQKMEAIGTLAGGIAHDFNNILSVIIGYTELAKDRSQKENKERDLQEVLIGAERARNLVKQILAFSRQDGNEKKPLDIKVLLKEAVKFLRSSIPTTVEINQQLTAEECNIMADPTQMHQVIMNLCTNAAHAMKEAGGTLKIELSNIEQAKDEIPNHPHLQKGHYVKLTISDTGYGIDPDNIQKIFDPFFTTKSVDEGTGLGLSVVYGIVKGHGGVINVYSEQGKGAAFHVYLPRIIQTETMEADAGRPVIGGTERILFVDDEPSLVDIGMRMLFPLGYHVTGAASSKEALELFRAEPQRFDLVITDMTLPKMTGIDLSREMLKIRPNIPIILCSGIKEPDTEAQAKSLGIKAYLTKPLTSRELAQDIRKVLNDPKLFACHFA